MTEKGYLVTQLPGDPAGLNTRQPGNRETGEPPTQLRRTLGLADLVLAQILLIVGLSSVGPAARLGSLQWIYWLLGILLFQVPLALVVMHLTRAMPREGALYQWTRAAFGDFAGFMVAWNFWNFVIVLVSTIGLTIAAGIGYASGAAETFMSNRVWQAGMSALAALALVLLAVAGFGTAKWLSNLASLTLLLVGALFIALPLFSRETRAEPQTMPFSLMQVVLFTRIAVYALAGFEGMSIVVGECRGGARSVARSIAIAFPCIGAIYILATRSVLKFVAPADVDLVNPVAQTFAIALHPFGRVAVIAASVAIVLLIVRDFAQSSQVFALVTRMPLVAGWDHLVPSWFTKLQPRTKTPVNAILFAGLLTFLCSFAAIAFAGRQEAFQILLSIAGVLFATTYLVMFAIPLLKPAPWWLRIAAGSGFIVTATFLVLAFVPIVEVRSTARYAAIVATAVAAVNTLGAFLFAASRIRRPVTPARPRSV
jgi:amino acid transporter